MLNRKSQTSNELEGYFLPCTTLYLTNEYFYGGLIENYLSLEDLQMLIHYRYERILGALSCKCLIRVFKDSLTKHAMVNTQTAIQ